MKPSNITNPDDANLTQGVSFADVSRSRGSGSETETDSFITGLNDTIFSQLNDDYFPIDVKVAKLTNEVTDILNKFKLPLKNNLALTNKQVSNKLLTELLPLTKVEFNYSKFISHPGNVFVKNFSKSKISHGKLFKYFNSQSQYKSLTELNLFNLNSNNDEEIFAILKFDNYLDVDFLLNKKFGPNPYNVVSSHQLYLNKYISKKERKLTNDEYDEFNNYNTLIVNNLLNFFPEDYKFSLTKLGVVFEKLKLFGTVSSIYFPVTLKDDTEDSNDKEFSLVDFGFVTFENSESSNLDLLKCIYFLNNTTFEEFMSFSETDIYNLSNDINTKEKHNIKEDDRGSRANEVKISIAQHKHNHHLYQYYPNLLVCEQKTLSLNYVDYNYHSILINSFVKYFNYQETNIYVNNFPMVFKNNDELWEQFWQQFGSIKSAKIIKPQFYSKADQSVGKIGFVFFNDFQMAVKAIILTNNKFVSVGDNSNYLIKTSFAIQRLNKEKRKKSGEGLEMMVDQHPYQKPPQGKNKSKSHNNHNNHNQTSPIYYYDQMNDPNSRSVSVGSNEEDDGYNSYTYGQPYGQPVPMMPQYSPPPFQPYFYPMMVPGPMSFVPYYNYGPNYSVNSPK